MVEGQSLMEEVRPCGCGESRVSRKSFLGRTAAAIAAMGGLFALSPGVSKANNENPEGGCYGDAYLEIQTCWDQVWYTDCIRVCKIWCFAIWFNGDDTWCTSTIVDLGYC